MQAHGVVHAALASAAVKRPRHARQGGEKRAVAGQPPGRAGRQRAQVGQFAGDVAKQGFEQGGLDEVLRLRKTAQAHGPRADAALHPGQRAGLDERAHGARDGIQKTEEEKAQIVAQPQTPLGILKGAVERHGPLADEGPEPDAEIPDDLQRSTDPRR